MFSPKNGDLEGMKKEFFDCVGGERGSGYAKGYFAAHCLSFDSHSLKKLVPGVSDEDLDFELVDNEDKDQQYVAVKVPLILFPCDTVVCRS